MTTFSRPSLLRSCVTALPFLAFACNGSDIVSPSSGEAPVSIPPTGSSVRRPPAPATTYRSTPGWRSHGSSPGDAAQVT
jgi:hypothetical protein